MKPLDLLERLQAIEGPMEVTLSPGPFVANCNWPDAIAAKLLLWLYEQMPEDATYGDLENTLLSALWWSQFLMMQPTTASQRSKNKQKDTCAAT